jgi:AraC-like DNA-binding protein
MPEKDLPIRRLFLPPKGRPHWLPLISTPLELNYLSWGQRWYGDAEITPSLHEGWHYFVVLSGSPTLVVAGHLLRVEPGTVTICDPDCPIGHSDEPGHACQMLTWIWRTAPAHSALRPASGGFLNLELDKSLVRRVVALHAQCREAVALATERSMLELRAARLHLDLCLLEAHEHRHAADRDFRLNLAIEYLRNHLGDLDPVRRLCEYLQISSASLKRLFHEHTGKSPRAFALDWRMRWARDQLLARRSSVKAIAYALGYRHANDFSRAFKRHYGHTARRILDSSKAE